jgi:hypothetical protein
MTVPVLGVLLLWDVQVLLNARLRVALDLFRWKVKMTVH